MAESDTLFSWIIPRITNRVEDIATEALGFIFDKSVYAREALQGLVQVEGFNFPRIDSVRTQVVSEGTTPDFVGFDGAGSRRLIGESKFWAELVGGQPNDYFDQLPSEGPGVVLFVAPNARIETLWHELRRRVGEPLGPDTGSRDTPSALYTPSAGMEKRLMLVSWGHLLDEIARHAILDPVVQSDVQQLRGLTERMDERAFLPLHDNELSPEFIRRFHHFQRLASKCIDRGRREGWIADVANNTSRWPGGYGRRFRLSGIQAWFGIDGDAWAERGNTPMWLQLEGITPEMLSVVHIGSGLHVKANWLYVPILLKTSAEENEVLDNVACQLMAIAKVIGKDTAEP